MSQLVEEPLEALTIKERLEIVEDIARSNQSKIAFFEKDQSIIIKAMQRLTVNANSKFDNLGKKIDFLSDEVKEIKTEIVEIKTEITEIKTDITEIKTGMNLFEKNIEEKLDSFMGDIKKWIYDVLPEKIKTNIDKKIQDHLENCPK